MGIVIDARAALRQLGTEQERPLALLRCAGALISRHLLEPGRPWLWDAQEPRGDELLVICFAEVPLRLRFEEGRVVEVPAGAACLLHPHQMTTVSSAQVTTVTAVWVRHDAVAQAASRFDGSGTVLSDGAVARSLRAFLLGLLSDPASATAGGLAETLIVGAVDLVLSDAMPSVRVPRGVDRARGIIRLRRTDPAFDVDALAVALHLSRRQLQRMFAREGTTPLAELRAQRVQDARRLMDDRVESLDAVAAQSGFRDVAGMRRAFLREGLPTPRHLRADALL